MNIQVVYLGLLHAMQVQYTENNVVVLSGDSCTAKMCNPQDLLSAKSSEKPSYSEQFQILKGCTDPSVLKSAYPKPSKEAQALVPGAFRIPFTNLYTRKEARPLLAAETTSMPPLAAKIKNAIMKVMRCIILIAYHSVALGFAYQTFSLRNLLLAWASYVVVGMIGVNFCYHRMLTHRSFKTYKWLEYLSSWIGINTAQGEPTEWVSRVLWGPAAGDWSRVPLFWILGSLSVLGHVNLFPFS